MAMIKVSNSAQVVAATAPKPVSRAASDPEVWKTAIAVGGATQMQTFSERWPASRSRMTQMHPDLNGHTPAGVFDTVSHAIMDRERSKSSQRNGSKIMTENTFSAWFSEEVSPSRKTETPNRVQIACRIDRGGIVWCRSAPFYNTRTKTVWSRLRST